MFKNIPIAFQWVTGMVMFISLIGGISWGMAVWVNNMNVKAQKTDDLGVKTDSISIIVKSVQKSLLDFKTEVMDSLDNRGKQIRLLSKEVNVYASDQQKLANSYATYVRDNTKFTKDFTKYMEGLHFTLILPMEKGLDPQIRIEQMPPK